MNSPPNHPIAYSITQIPMVMIMNPAKQPKPANKQPRLEPLPEVLLAELVVLELERLDDDWFA